MGRKPEGRRPLTVAERQARIRIRKAAEAIMLRQALVKIATIRTAKEARAIAAAAIES
jgi:hypothetical protein